MKILAIVALGASFLFGAVDINTAKEKELMTLKGIGAKKATAIVTYRKKHCFKSVNDLTSVKGIGAKFIDNNKKNLSASKCKK
ncbi:helix-hairpin-helix domain-containing protein [Sulfurimonas aquatica]|uniref:Helix-hairpin-helix domain-containing protein n=1 Tax=Sulfurimonas aquatica TaxID=2672570 RepID=A0A975B182_9BACT|nr:helix-hairpin-helix domain-containing protein [Sulfurimonas aquatica]QSZ42342.1 helix-hairpin-helix domain-containing protein [Sulfurimonas aquatica]